MGFCLRPQEVKVRRMNFLNQDTLIRNSAVCVCVCVCVDGGHVPLSTGGTDF